MKILFRLMNKLHEKVKERVGSYRVGRADRFIDMNQLKYLVDKQKSSNTYICVGGHERSEVILSHRRIRCKTFTAPLSVR